MPPPTLLNQESTSPGFVCTVGAHLCQESSRSAAIHESTEVIIEWELIEVASEGNQNDDSPRHNPRAVTMISNCARTVEFVVKRIKGTASRKPLSDLPSRGSPPRDRTLARTLPVWMEGGSAHCVSRAASDTRTDKSSPLRQRVARGTTDASETHTH